MRKLGLLGGSLTLVTTTGAEHLTEGARIQWVAIQDDVAMVEQKAIHSVGEVTRDLLHPRAVRLVHDAGDLHTSCCEVDDEQQVVSHQTSPSDSLDGEEVHGSDGTPMCTQKGTPGNALRRSGAGVNPASCKMRLMVLRPMSWPTLCSAPRIRV